MELKDRMGLGGTDIVIVAVLLIAAVAVTAVVMQGQTAGDETEYDGQFNQLQPVQELTGYNDLTVSTVNLNESNTAATFVTDTNLNTTNGDTSRLVYGVNIDGAINDVDVEQTNALTGDEFNIESVKLVRDDDDDVSISEAQPVATFRPDNNGEYDREGIGPIEDGDYAFVLVLQGSNADSLSGGEDLYTIEWDASEAESDSDGSDEVRVTLQNAN